MSFFTVAGDLIEPGRLGEGFRRRDSAPDALALPLEAFSREHDSRRRCLTAYGFPFIEPRTPRTTHTRAEAMMHYHSDEYTRAVHQARAADAQAVRSSTTRNRTEESWTHRLRDQVGTLLGARRPHPCPEPCPDAA